MFRSLVCRGTLTTVLAAAVATVACSNDGQATTPVTPTASSASREASGGQGEAEVKGTIAAGSLSGSCGAASIAFRIGARTITTNAQTRFDDITCGALSAGDVIEVHGTPQADGSLMALRIEPEK